MKNSYLRYLLLLIGISLTSIIIYKRLLPKYNTDTWHHLHHQAYTALHDEQYENVLDICDRAILTEDSPVNRYLIYIRKAKALNKLHRYDDALKTLDLALEIEPNKEAAYVVQVDALFNLGLEEELMTSLEKIASINPRSPLKRLLTALRLQCG